MDLGTRWLIIGMLALVGLIFSLGVLFVFLKYGRDRDRWKVVDEERLAQDEFGRQP